MSANITKKQVIDVLAALKRATGKNYQKDITVGQAFNLKPSMVKTIRLAGSWAEYERRKGVKAEKATAAKNVTVTKPAKKSPGRPKKNSIRAGKEFNQTLNAVVKGTHASSSTTPKLYDPKAAFDLAQMQINDLKRNQVSQTQTITTLLETVQAHTRTIRDMQKISDALIEGHNEAIKVETPHRRRWPFVKGQRG